MTILGLCSAASLAAFSGWHSQQCFAVILPSIAGSLAFLGLLPGLVFGVLAKPRSNEVQGK
jgi:hypothetical protein